MSSPISAVQVVNILNNDAHLLRHWVQFGDNLGVDAGTQEDLKRRLNSGNLTPYELLREALNVWISRNGSDATISRLWDILMGMEAKDCAQRLRKAFPSLPQIAVATRNSDVFPLLPRPPIRFGVGSLVDHFTGRQEQLDRLIKLLDTKTQVVVISGLGGMGKTELAKKFISQLPEASVVTWLSGETAAMLMASLIEFCQFVGLTTTQGGEQLPSTQLVQKATEWLVRNFESSRFVVVVDNVDGVYPELVEVTLALKSYQNSFIVITSGRKDIFPGQSEPIHLKELEDPDAIALVQSALGSKVDPSNAQRLCHKLQNFPLTLQQATAYIYLQQSLKGSYDIQRYLRKFKKRFTVAVGVSLGLEGYDKTTLTVWELTMNKVKRGMGPEGQLAYSVLEVLAFVNPDGIHVDILKKLVSLATNSPFGNSNDLSLSAALKTLSQFCLVRYDKPTVSVHRLVQNVTRFRMGERPRTFLGQSYCLTKRSRTTKFLLGILEGLKMNQMTKGEVPHVLSVWDHFTQEEIPITIIFSHIPFQIFNRLIDLSMINESHGFAESNLNLLQGILGEDHKQTLSMQRNMALTLQRKGEYAQALATLQVVNGTLKRILGRDDPSTLATAFSIASVLCEQGRYPEALEWGIRVLQLQIKAAGVSGYHVMDTRHLIAVVLHGQGKYLESMQMFQLVLEWQTSQLGHQHPKTLGTRHDIGSCLFSQGTFEEAKDKLQSVLEARQEVLGEEHMDTLLTKYALARTLDSLGQRVEALAMLDEVLDGQRIIFGETHPETLETRNAISDIESSRSFTRRESSPQVPEVKMKPFLRLSSGPTAAYLLQPLRSI